MPNALRAAAFAIFVACVSAALALTCAGCKTTSVPGPVKTVVSDVVDCTKGATQDTALHILDDAASALATGNWEAALLDLATRWGGDAVACVLDRIRGESTRFNATSTEPDRLEAMKAARASQWLAENHVVFAGADGGAR